MMIWTVHSICDRQNDFEGAFSTYAKALAFVDKCKANPVYDGMGFRVSMETLDIHLVEERSKV